MHQEMNHFTQDQSPDTTFDKVTSEISSVLYDDLEEDHSEPSTPVSPQMYGNRLYSRKSLSSFLRLEESEESPSHWADTYSSTTLVSTPPSFPAQTEEIPPPYALASADNRLSYEVVNRERRPTEYEIVAFPSHTPTVAFCPFCQTSVEVYAKLKTNFLKKLTTVVSKLFRSRQLTNKDASSILVNFSKTKYLCKVCDQDIHLTMS
ncbi:hypothetical protein K7432_009779 [Basidiobolus ranarum]|uniref:LITAF domain-containing protein n=1 Tax=Basidiobolus ranarum TaxID=34480 RepID=A0ABR2VWJ0_9FUNG